MPTETRTPAAEMEASPAACNNSRPGAGFICGYLTFLYCAQTIYAYLYVHSPFLRAAFVVPTVIRLAVWDVPIFVYLIARKESLIEFLKLRNPRRGVFWGAGIGLTLVLLNLIGAYALKGNVRVNFHLAANHWLGAVLTVGLSEEVVFRGFLLSAFAVRSRFWIANLSQAALFLCIHLPGWALMHQFIWPNIAQQMVYVAALGVMLGFVRKKNDSLWACMLIHSFSNFGALAIG